MALNRIAGAKACNHQLSGSATIWASMVGSTISHYKVFSELGGGGRTALIAAAFYGHGEAARILLQQGADPDARDQNDHTASMLAAHRGHGILAKSLQNSEAKESEIKTQVGLKPTQPPHSMPSLPGKTTAPPSPQKLLEEVATRRAVYLQVAADRVRAVIQRLITQLKGKGYPVWLYDKGDGWYRALVGPFRDKESTKSYQQRLRNDGLDWWLRLLEDPRSRRRSPNLRPSELPTTDKQANVIPELCTAGAPEEG